MLRQQAVEVGSSSGQVQNGMDVGYAVPSNRSFAQPAQQSTVAMQQVVASGNASMASPGGGQFVNASVQAGRATLPHSSSAPARIVGTSQSNLQIPLATAVPAAFPSGGTVPQYTNGSSLVSPEGVQGQRTELVYNGTQVANNISTGQRPPVPPGISRVAVAPPISTSPAPTYAGNPSLVSGSPAPTYAGNPSLVSGSPGMGAAVGTAVQPSGLGNEIGGGLWQGRVRPGGWQNTGMNPQSGTPVPANWSRTSAGSPAVSASNPSLPSGGAAQPAADYSHGPLWTSTQNRGSGNISMPSSQPRRTWSPVWASNRTPQLAPSRMGIQSQMLHSEGRSDTSVPAAAPAPVGATNQVISSHGVPASVPVTSPECVVNMAQDLEWRSVPPSNASQQPSLSVSASGEPQVGGDERAAAGVFEFVADHSSLPGSTSRAYVPVIYLSDDD
ncbi:hypothetical protein R1sor_019881 [Riccia sorocarpa]|uniref:Uncharacterized protein n=1 Tax=Riccia sorocarpa TaxID=122646 RepID=A0ABD3IFF8_9MARC